MVFMSLMDIHRNSPYILSPLFPPSFVHIVNQVNLKSINERVHELAHTCNITMFIWHNCVFYIHGVGDKIYLEKPSTNEEEETKYSKMYICDDE